MRKKFLAGILSLCMVATLMPVTAFAADNETAPVPTEPVVTEAPAEATEPAPEITITLDESAPEAEVPVVEPTEPVVEPTEPVVEPTEPEEPVEPETPAEPVVADTTAAPVEEAPAMLSLTRGASDVATYADDTPVVLDDAPTPAPVEVKVVGVGPLKEGANTVGGGTITFDPNSKTVTIANVKIEVENGAAIMMSPEMTIILVGENTIVLNTKVDEESGYPGAAYAIEAGDITIKGDGKLAITTGTIFDESGVYGIIGTNVKIDGTTVNVDLSKANNAYSYGIQTYPGDVYDESTGEYKTDESGKTGNLVINNSNVDVKAYLAVSAANNVNFSGNTKAKIESIAKVFGDEKIGRPGVDARGKIIFDLTQGGNVTAIGGDGKCYYDFTSPDATEPGSWPVAPGLLARKGIELGEGNILSGGQVKEIKLSDGTSIWIIADANGNPVREVSVSNPEVKQASVLGTNTVKTGDHTSVALWMMLALVSAMGIAVVVRRKVTL